MNYLILRPEIEHFFSTKKDSIFDSGNGDKDGMFLFNFQQP